MLRISVPVVESNDFLHYPVVSQEEERPPSSEQRFVSVIVLNVKSLIGGQLFSSTN